MEEAREWICVWEPEAGQGRERGRLQGTGGGQRGRAGDRTGHKHDCVFRLQRMQEEGDGEFVDRV